MIRSETAQKTVTVVDNRRLQRIREKFSEIFGSALTLPDDAVLQRYSLTSDGDLVMILR